MTTTSDSLETRVLLRPTASGAWIVRDAQGENGGYFRDRAAAMKFIRREFGAGARPQPVAADAARGLRPAA